MSDPQLSPRESEGKSPSLWQTLLSVNAAFFGVQNRGNRERDFKHGKVSHFIAMGVVMTVVFVLLVLAVVRFALRSAGV